MRATLYLLILTFFYSLNSIGTITAQVIHDNGDPSKYVQRDTNSQKTKIIDANKKFKITDSVALELLLKVKEIKEIKSHDYHDSITSNDLILISIPSDSDKRWEFDMGQFQKGLDKYYSFIHFWVNANSGKIEVLDLNYGVDDPIDLSNWLKLKRKN
jgi:hypothetical protein